MWNSNTLDEREIPPMSAEMFSALVTARLRSTQDIEFQSGKGLQLKLRVRGNETTAQLERAYERYRANPDHLTPVIDQFIATLVQGTGERNVGNEAFARVREKLLPRLMTAQQWMKKRDDGLRLVIRSLVQDLGVALILDQGEAFEYVQLDAIPAWGVDSETAYNIALENFERASATVQTSVNGRANEILRMDHSANAATRALLPSRRADWQARVQGELVLGLPTHDLLLGFSRAHPAFDALRAQIAEDARANANGLLPYLVRIQNETWELLG